QEVNSKSNPLELIRYYQLITFLEKISDYLEKIPSLFAYKSISNIKQEIKKHLENYKKQYETIMTTTYKNNREKSYTNSDNLKQFKETYDKNKQKLTQEIIEIFSEILELIIDINKLNY
ncbi:MAG: hypothetical protein ACQESC_04700, partial [Nanobdellota archaeon]